MTRQKTQLVSVKMPRALRDALEELALIHTESYTAGRINLDNRFGDVAPDRQRLPLWYPVAKSIEATLRRLERRGG